MNSYNVLMLFKDKPVGHISITQYA